jgi:hypothetical protein
MERRAVPGELSGRRGVATLVRSFPVAVAFPFIAASLRRSVEVCNNIADNLSKAGWSLGCVSGVDSNGRTIWIADAHREIKRFASKEIPAAWSARLHGRIFEAVTATVRGSRRDARASPSEQQCNPIEPDENSLQIPTMVQERGRSTLQPKMRSHTIENRFYAMSLDRPDISIFSRY